MRSGRALLVLAVVGALALAARPARADRIAEAEDLFRRAKALTAAGKHADACPLFAESYRLDPGVGTLLNLALCHERIGRVASAWGEFRAVEQHARTKNPERAALAREHAEGLEGRLSRLAIIVPDVTRATPGLVVAVDGEEKSAPLWPGVPVDAGTHVIDVSAPGKKPVKVPATVLDEGVVVRVELPALEDADEAASAAAEPTEPGVPTVEQAAARPARRTTGYAVGGVGLATLAAGAGFGIAAIAEDTRAEDTCRAPCVRGSAEADEADRITSRAVTFANVSNVTIPLGAIGLVVGAYLVLTSGAAPARVQASVGARGLLLSGEF